MSYYIYNLSFIFCHKIHVCFAIETFRKSNLNKTIEKSAILERKAKFSHYLEDPFISNILIHDLDEMNKNMKNLDGKVMEKTHFCF